ncbi:VTT domain-containing protein [Candidatus Viridilinea mediisalina]|uniref:DedA family protein n=1 Tax=Candidatus Viridilinea mediisalina TaxID=2024553 RepID=A0A2A6RFT6_9CHLR|nr:VTT domain-containing protein [Candidatus Viridilinea mediisalina]PDW01720.1 DedA family protein [Candidatus Viridilinea mediisalina]
MPPRPSLLRPILVGLIFVVANVLAYLLLPPALIERLGAFGYVGALLAATLANATVIVPVPYYPLIMRLGQALNPWGVVFAAALGSALGELVAYYVGRSGRHVAETTPFYLWVQRQLRHPWRAPLVIFLLAAPPNPLFDVAGLLAGALGVPVWVFFISTFLGRIARMSGLVLFGVWLDAS